MATFYYDRFSNENIYSQWTKHLQSEGYIKDISDIISKNRKELQTTINNASGEHQKAIQQVCGSLDDGFGLISSHLSDIKYELGGIRGEINAMASMLDWKLSMLIEEQRLTNQLLGHIAQLLRIPDSQKQRVYYIEQGLKYLKNAFIEDISSSFYDDAIDSFKAAENIERKDFIILNRIGQIYFYSKKHMNIPLAEEYFLKSAREAIAEANVGGTTTSNKLSPSGYQPLLSSQDYFKSATAEAYLYASRTCYLQQKLSEAAKYAEKGYCLIPEFVEAGFEQAKYLAANNQIEESVKVLETVIKKDRYYSVKTLSDQDLSSKPLVLKLLANFQQEAIQKAKIEYDDCKSIMSIGSKAKPTMDRIEENISKKSFLSCMYALDLLNADYQIPYNNYTISSYNGEEINRRAINEKIKIIELIKKENYSANELESLKSKIKNKIVTTRTFGGLGIGVLFGIVIGFFKGCTLKDFSMDGSVWLNTIIVCALIGTAIGAFVGFVKEVEIKD